jgi:hypothetical protein
VILLAVLGAAVLTAAPCAELPAWDQALALAQKAPAGWPAEQARLEKAFPSLPLPPKTDDVAGQINRTRERLHAACAFAERSTPAFATPDSSRLSAILARPEFEHAQDKRAEWVKGWLRTLWSWLSGLLGSQGAGQFAHGTRTLVLGMAAAVVAFGAWRVLRIKRRKRRPPVRGDSDTRLRLDPPEAHLQRAQAALATDPREAIREGLLSLLSSLERRRLARPDRVKTNGEIVSELPARGASAELIAQVSPVVRWYDRTFYSLAPVATEDASGFLTSVSGLRSMIEGGA